MYKTQHKHTNQLIHESSPYLLQHAHNPVNWYSWGHEALEKAKKENKLIIVSIGYAACHWCHVMEHESFEDENVAVFMNEHFVSIKVDREERPDIDQVYMNAVQLMTGRGGWPLNCITLPDGRPIYGGTYFPSTQWLDVLSQILNFVKQFPDKTESQASSLTKNLQTNELVISGSPVQEFMMNDLDTIVSKWKNQMDYINGGQNGSPKFPLPVGDMFLLQYHAITGDPEVLTAINLSLTKMANGGIYDQIGSGFSRYSTDEKWKVPHFEKMLYDNAQLVSLYSMAYQQTKEAKYKVIVEDTLEFVQRELSRAEGGFYSSIDADSEGVEGKFYVWTYKELIDILGNQANLFIDYFNITENGNWEDGNNILFTSENSTSLSKKYNITTVELNEKLSVFKQTLLKFRNKRIHPGLDDKILTSWNGLMIKAFADAYRVFNKPLYLEIATKNADFILDKLKTSENKLHRNFNNGKASINGFLDDYAFVIEAFISLYKATFDEKWLSEAMNLTHYSLSHFYDSNSGMFYYTSDLDPALIARKMELSDNVIPSSNSTLAKNLFQLGHYFYKDDFIEKAKIMLSNVKQNIMDIGIYGANWDILMLWCAVEPFEVAIVGKNSEKLRTEIESHFLANIILSGGSSESKLPILEGKYVENETLIYICKNKACYQPVNNVTDALEKTCHKI